MSVIVSRKGGYTIYGQMNPKTKKLHSFQIKGVNVNPHVVYPYYTEAENIVAYQIRKHEEAKLKKEQELVKKAGK